MDTRNKNGQGRADGSGQFSPRSFATPACHSSEIAKPHAACAFAFTPHAYPQTAKPHAACAFAICVLALPLAALADDPGSSTTVVLDVAKNGSLGALVTAALFWLNSQRKQRCADAQTPPPPERNPPLGEDVARTYVTKLDMQECRGVCRKDIDDLRAKIDANDHAAEQRSVSTHRRIDQVFVSQQKTNKALGMMVGIMVGKGVAPASMATLTISEEG